MTFVEFLSKVQLRKRIRCIHISFAEVDQIIPGHIVSRSLFRGGFIIHYEEEFVRVKNIVTLNNLLYTPSNFQ